MTLALKITSAWEATNEAGGCFASALHALRTEEVDTPVVLRRPARKATEKDQIGEVLLLVTEAKRHARDIITRAEAIEAAAQQKLATR